MTMSQPENTKSPIEMASSAAYEAALPEIEAVAETDLSKIVVDVMTVVPRVLGKLPKLRELRPSILEEMPKLDITKFDKLEMYTLALFRAQTALAFATKDDHGLPERAERLVKVRELWLAELTVLRTRGFVSGEPSGLLGPNGYKNVAFDVTACAQFIRSNWSAMAGKSNITMAEVEEVEKLADYVTAMVQLRLESGDAAQRATLLRNKAFTLFLEAYEVARRAATAIRWDEGDAEDFAPSLYSGRTKKRELRGAEPTAPAGSNLGVPNASASTVTPSPAAAPGLPNVPPSPVLPSTRFEE
jgi:hypothetical protein